jgi:pyridoxal 5'-phosphate synthase pdxT subunit
MIPPRIGVLALQGDVREHLEVLRELDVDAVGVRRVEELNTLDGIVLPGGESTTMAKLLVAFELFEPLGKAIEAGLPTYGSCAGMILLADRIEGGTADQVTLGGIDVTVRRNAFGRQVDSFESDVEWHDGSTVPGVFIRAPWVEARGSDVEVLGRTAGRIVAVQQANLLATAFHPEISGDARVHRHFVGMVETARNR